MHFIFTIELIIYGYSFLKTDLIDRFDIHYINHFWDRLLGNALSVFVQGL